MTHRLAAVALATLSISCASAGGRSGSTIRTGPETGSVVVVGGGSMGPEIVRRFIELAGGPDAPIVVIPTAQGAASYSQTSGGAQQFRDLGAKDVVVMHTDSKAIANADTFVARIKRARGVWFGGGRHFRLVDSYAGTASEAAFHDVLARGGVVGGSSAGASILASYLIRGAPSNDNRMMSHPQYLEGFGFLKNIAIDQHVVARGRLPDLHDSVTSRQKHLLGISEDEGTAWVIRGDTGEIIGRGKGFVYNGREKDEGKPFLTLWPGDRYDLGARRLMSRAIDGTRLTHAFVDSLFTDIGGAPAAILVAQNGKVLVNKSWNITPQGRYQPTTTTGAFTMETLFSLMMFGTGGPGDEPVPPLAQRLIARAGMAHTRYDTTARTFITNVDDLYRLERLRAAERENGATDGWITEASGPPHGKRFAFVRDRESGAVVIIMTESASFGARLVADAIVARLR